MQINKEISSAKKNISHMLPMLFIFAMLILHLSMPDKTYSKEESRYFTQFPVFKAERVLNGSYGAKIEEYFSDQFPFREFWIQISHQLNGNCSRVQK